MGALALAGCSAPEVEGYQLQATPEGFLYAASREWGQGMVPGLTVTGQGLWVGDIRSDEPHTTISLTSYRGRASRGDAEEARDARAQRLAGFSRNVLGPVRDVPLADGGTAWAWTEERQDEYGRRSMKVSAVIAFDTASFALELDTDVPERVSEAHLDAILGTFALGRIRWHPGPLAAAFLALVAAALFLRRRMRPRHATAYRLWEKAPAPKSPPHPPDAPAPRPPDAP